MSTYVSVQDVRDVWDGDATDDRIQALLNRAETILRVKVPALADRLSDGRTDAGMLAIVLSNVVIRLLNNPMGFKGEHAGEVGYYFGSDQGIPGKLGFTSDDLTDLGLDFAPRARSVRLTSPALNHHGGFRSERW